MSSVTRRTVLRGLGSGAVRSWRRPCWREPQVRRPSPATGWRRPINNGNENAYGPSPRALAAIREVAPSAANEYPDQRLKHLRSTIASIHNVPVEQVVIGCGSTEILRMAADAFLAPNRMLVTARPTCEVISDFAVARGAKVAAIPLSPRHSAICRPCWRHAAGQPAWSTSAIPDNPTGTVTRRRTSTTSCGAPDGPAVVIDEAYHHYVGDSPESTSFLDRPAAQIE